jgi:penicillin amidase
MGLSDERLVPCPDCRALVPDVDGPTHAYLGGNAGCWATWGELHQERHAHPLGSARWLERILGLNVGPYASEGGPNTLRPDDYRIWTALDEGSWTPPWTSEYGPSERFVAEIAPDGIRAGFLIPTGQSGNPLSPHYRDLNDRWRGGDLVELPLDPASASARAERTLTFQP